MVRQRSFQRDKVRPCIYDEDYFLRGKQTGKSLYEDYRWMPDLTIPMVRSMVDYLGIRDKDIILDFGCARGYVVKAFRMMEYPAYGYDVSEWAVGNADHDAYPYLTRRPELVFNGFYDWVIAKDVLEHIVDVDETVDNLKKIACKGVFAVVPLAHSLGRYDVPEYEKDVTHVHRRPLQWWVGLFHQAGWAVDGRYRVPGIKDNYKQFPTGNGFITARRIPE